ncbi:MAG TPA: hypothetical protein V6C84_24605 [Coleofasciculaceae cyanobacterium]
MMPFQTGEKPYHLVAGATIQVKQVRSPRVRDVLKLKQRRTNKYRPWRSWEFMPMRSRKSMS